MAQVEWKRIVRITFNREGGCGGVDMMASISEDFD